MCCASVSSRGQHRPNQMKARLLLVDICRHVEVKKLNVFVLTCFLQTMEAMFEWEDEEDDKDDKVA